MAKLDLSEFLFGWPSPGGVAWPVVVLGEMKETYLGIIRAEFLV